MTSVNRQIAAGIAWMSLMRIGVKGLGLVSTIILARLLVPADFGLVAMAMSIIMALELFRDFSFDVALIHKQDADRSYYDTAWTFNALFGLGLGLILLVIAFPAAEFYQEERLRNVMHALAIGVFISGFENIGVVAFRKDLEFHKEFLFRVAQKICTFAITVPLAFALRSYWALVIGMVCGNVLNVIISYYAHPFRPRFSIAAGSQLFSFSKWLLANNLLWFLRDRSPYYVLGRVSGSDALGLFTVSFEISNLPTTELVAPINRAVLPGYARLAHDLEELRQGFLNVIGLVLALALPAGFGIAATSKLLVPVVLGDKWIEAVPLVSLFAIYGALNAAQTNCGAIHYATGQPRTLTVIGVIQLSFLLPCVIWGGYAYGAIGIAWAYLANVIMVILPLNYGFVLNRLRLPFRRLSSLCWRPVLATAFMYSVTVNWIDYLDAVSVTALLSSIAVGAAAYGIALGGLWLVAGRPQGPESTLVDKFLLPAWNRISRAPG